MNLRPVMPMPPASDDVIDDLRQRAMLAHRAEREAKSVAGMKAARRLRLGIVNLLRDWSEKQPDNGRRLQMQDLAATLEALR